MEMHDLFKNETKIPSLPEVFYRFKEAVEDPDTSFEELGEIISCDSGLTVHLLKIVNSPFYGFQNQVETIPHAISIIGCDQLNDLVLAASIIDRFKNAPTKGIDMQLFWEHSIACGLAAKILANHLGMINPDSLFVGGLLHDIGRLVICLNAPRHFAEIYLESRNSQTYLENQDEAKSLLTVENEILGFGHDEVGGELLRRWRLPKIHQETVRYHHSPIEALLFNKEASIVNIADNISKSLALGSSGEFIISKYDEAMEILDIRNEDFFLPIIKEIQEKYQNTTEVFFQTA